MSFSNFEIISSSLPDLFEYCFFAEKYLKDDPDSTLVKLRKFTELAVHKIYQLKQIPDAKLNFYELTTNPQFFNAVPEEVYRSINFLRVEGNKSAHPKQEPTSKQMSKDIALKALQEAYLIAVWMSRAFFNNNSTAAFKNPEGYYAEEIKNRANQGDPDAQFSMGLKYYVGRDEPSDYQKAFYWFKHASEQGHSRAQAYLGSLFLEGKGVEQNHEQALFWIKKAIQLNEPTAQTLLGQMFLEGTGVEKDGQLALYWLEQAANQEDPIAQCCLGQMYQYGEGVEKNPEQAFKWTYRAAQYDDPVAYCNLGLFYEEGIGTEKNFDLAFEWYGKAAHEGIADALAAVGAFYINGVGCKQDIDEGLRFIELAAEKGSLVAYLNLGIYYKTGLNKEKDLVKALYWLEKAAKKSSSEAQYELAETILLLLENKIDITYTTSDARKLFVEAEKQGNPKAIKVMAEIRQKERENHKELAKTLSEFRQNLRNFFEELNKRKIGRNDPCPCGSGKKYKKCCMPQNVGAPTS